MNRRLLVRRLVSVGILTILVTLGARASLAAGIAGGTRSWPPTPFPAAPHDKRVVVVGVDRKTINETRTRSRGRGQVARLVDQLSAAGAAVIAFDVVFATESRPEEAQNDVLGPTPSHRPATSCSVRP